MTTGAEAGSARGPRQTPCPGGQTVPQFPAGGAAGGGPAAVL